MNIEMNDAFDLQAHQSACALPAAGGNGREMGGISTNEGDEVLNADTTSASARDQLKA